MAQTGGTQSSGLPSISRDEASRIARADAEKAYRDLSKYNVKITLEQDGWHVDYGLKDPKSQGGGPHYVIDPATGKISSKRYQQ